MPAVGDIAFFGLPPASRGQRGGLRDHGADRSAVPGSAVLRLPAGGGGAGGARPPRQPPRAGAAHGDVVNRKGVGRLMRLAGLVAIFQRPNTSKPAVAHKIYPYLLGGISIERVNQVWCADVTY